MNLAVTLSLYGGGPGSGCKGPNCGRPSVGGYVKNSSSFMTPPRPSTAQQELLDHYVVEPDGSASRVPSHIEYFLNTKQNYQKFLESGGITVTVGVAGPGIVFGRKDQETVDKVLQIVGHPEFREYGATVEYLNIRKGEQLEFDGGVGKVAREMRSWVGQQHAA